MYRFLKSINNTDWVAEALAERFDQSIFDIMPDDSLIYGGSIRDILAGLPMKGDLDIALPSTKLANVKQILSDHPKWVEVVEDNTKPVEIEAPEETPDPAEPAVYDEVVEITSSPSGITFAEVTKNKVYKKETKIEDIANFVGPNGVEMQLISAGHSDGPLKNVSYSVVELIRKVDVVCCGVVMDKRGRVFEALDGAFEDCLNKVLRFNKLIIKTASMDCLMRRIEKLEKREHNGC